MAQQSSFADAMARFPGAVTIITTRENGLRFGMVATAVCSLSADPPSLIVCLNKGTSAHDPILRQKIFAVNLVSGDHAPVIRHFMASKGEDRFRVGDWQTLATGAPILNDATVSFDCELGEVHDGFTHSILIGTVMDCRTSMQVDQTCLLWHGRDFAEPSRLPV
ncbi:flavin reductase family protein [Rhizorhabdus histidinilytica]|uniref:flavin reductase family protein n=1 Tax=Rhizorhabdus histidinilytica TaxID=439228 RepID=UPI001AD9B574|nr:flavin reductase family protein [Rhizorhabdus histidinilytica]